MEVLLNNLASNEHDFLQKHDSKLALEVLTEALQSSSKDYSTYFSSKPIAGSIVEDIAEVEAEISQVEQRIRNALLDNKEIVLKGISDDSNTESLKQLHSELDQLWEYAHGSEKAEAADLDVASDLVVEEFLGQHTASKENMEEDEFRKAIEKLKSRMEANRTDEMNTSFASVLDGLDSVLDIMELPFLGRTCIQTGHYQEALSLFKHSESMVAKFPASTIVGKVHANVLNEVTTTMLGGLVKLLSTDVNTNSLKNIIRYMSSIPPFDAHNSSSLLQVYLAMRFDYIHGEIMKNACPPGQEDYILEMNVKRQIEVIREHVHTSLDVFGTVCHVETEPLRIPLILDPESGATTNTNPLMLQFVNQCVTLLLDQLEQCPLNKPLSDSICLQLIYCSFRLRDSNANYHHLFLNKTYNTTLFSPDQLKEAIRKRQELATKYN